MIRGHSNLMICEHSYLMLTVQHLVALGHLKVHGEVQIGKGRLEGDHELFPCLGAVHADEVIDVVLGVGCVQDCLVAAGKVFVEQAEIDGVVVG
jgi:hypothetical protein